MAFAVPLVGAPPSASSSRQLIVPRRLDILPACVATAGLPATIAAVVPDVATVASVALTTSVAATGTASTFAAAPGATTSDAVASRDVVAAASDADPLLDDVSGKYRAVVVAGSAEDDAV